MPRSRRQYFVSATCGIAALSVVSAALIGAVPLAGSLVAPAAAAAGDGIESLGPIAVVAGSGQVAPTPPVSVVRGGVAMSPRPVLLLTGDMAAATEVEVVDVSLGRSRWTWVGQVRSGRVTIARDLASGHAYTWRWRSGSGEWKSGGSFVARFDSGSGQGWVSVGSASVSAFTGEVAVGWSSGAVSGPAGSVGVELKWRSSAVGADSEAAAQGAADGWSLSASSGSPWRGLVESRDSIVRGVAPGAPRAVLAAGSLNVAWRYPVGGARGFDIEVKNSRGRWVAAGHAPASANSETYQIVVSAPPRVSLGAKIRIVAHVGKGDLSTRYILTSGVDLASAVAQVQDHATRTALAPAAPVGGSGSGGLVVAGDAPRSVTVWGWDGSALTFVRNASGVYEQVLTAASDVAGARNSLNRRLLAGAWVWEMTDISGVVTTFADGRPVSVAGGGMPLSTMKWNGDRLVEVRPAGVATDAPRAIGLVYAGSGSCPSDAWTAFGFAPAPDGMLCRITYGSGVATDIGYVAGVGGRVQVALIKESAGDGMTLGWDSVGHLVSTRSGFVSRSALVDPSVKSLVARLDYDGVGRAAVLREAAPAVGAASIQQTIAFPRIDETAAIAGATVTARIDTSAGPASWSRTIDFNAANQAVTGGVDRAGMKMTVVSDNTGRPQKVIDPEKRITAFTYDESGIQTGQSGPFTGDSTKGLVINATYDSDVVAGKVTAWTGMQARVYPGADYAGAPTGAWWGKDDRAALGYSWRDLPQGSDARWSARATAQWTPASDSRDWSFRIDSNGATVSLLVEGELCATDNAGRCDITDLPAGPKSVVVQLDNAGDRGGFRILASPAGGEPALVPAAQVQPKFGLVTAEKVNDTYPGSERTPQTTRVYSKPWAQEVASTTRPGGLTAFQSVEDVDPANGQWGRPLSRTTPGGRTVAFSYYPDAATAAAPTVCGGGPDMPQYGGLRTVTRQDGTSEERIYDSYGQIIALITRGEQGAVQTSCAKYDEAGVMVSRRIFNSNGDLIEATVVDAQVDGKPWLSTTTVTHGPAAPVAPGQSITTTTQIDMAARVVRFVDAFGTVTTTAYNALGGVRTVIVTAPASAGSRVLRMDYTYTSVQNWIDTVKVNGVQAAKVNYDTTLGRIESIVYADGTSVAYDYFGNGQASKAIVTTPSGRVVNTLDLKGTGRTMGSQVTATGANAYTESRDYSYDEAGRLVAATIASTQAGLPASTDYTYAYDAQAGRCAAGYAGASKDSLRSGGSRNGVVYTTCHDADGRTTSTTDPLLTGGSGVATLTHDRFGRVTRIGGAADMSLTWGSDAQLAILADGDTRTTMNTFSGALLTKSVVKGSDPASVIGYGRSAPAETTYLYSMAGRVPNGVVSTQLDLPGSASVTMPTGGLAVMTLSDLEGAALVSVPVQSLGAGPANTDVAPEVGPSPRFGPYGEALAAPTFTSAVPHKQWQHAAGLDTLAGDSSITVMGARPYLPALGEFLAKDPDVHSGSNLYSFTGGDVVNSADWSGGSETCGLLCWGLAGGAAIAALFGPVGALIGSGLAAAAVAKSVMAAKANGEAPLSNMEVIFSSAALVFAGGKLIQSAIGAGLIKRYLKKQQMRGRSRAPVKASGEQSGEALIKPGNSSSVGTEEINAILKGKGGNLVDEVVGSPTNSQGLSGQSFQHYSAGESQRAGGNLFREQENFLQQTSSIYKRQSTIGAKLNNKMANGESDELSSKLSQHTNEEFQNFIMRQALMVLKKGSGSL